MNGSVMKDKNDERKYIIAPSISNQRKLDKIQKQNFLLRWLVLDVSQSNKQHQKFKRETQKMQQRQPMERCIKSKKQLSTKKFMLNTKKRILTKTIKKSQAKHCFAISSSDKNMGQP